MEDHLIESHGYSADNLPDVTPAETNIREQLGMKFNNKTLMVREREADKQRCITEKSANEQTTVVRHDMRQEDVVVVTTQGLTAPSGALYQTIDTSGLTEVTQPTVQPDNTLYAEYDEGTGLWVSVSDR